MDTLHDWHVTAYMLAVHGRIDVARIREKNGQIIFDNDPDKEALCKSIYDEQCAMRKELQSLTVDAMQKHWGQIENMLQAALSPAPPPRIEPSTATATPAPVVAASDAPAPLPVANREWVAQAQARAHEIIKMQKDRDLYPSQKDLGDWIASEFRKNGVVGADGKPLAGATIKRHALKGISSATGKQLSTTIVRGK